MFPTNLLLISCNPARNVRHKAALKYVLKPKTHRANERDNWHYKASHTCAIIQRLVHGRELNYFRHDLCDFIFAFCWTGVRCRPFHYSPAIPYTGAVYRHDTRTPASDHVQCFHIPEMTDIWCGSVAGPHISCRVVLLPN